jgi:pilus assembly protein Flp/PilA
MAFSLKALVNRFTREERGAAFVEYAMLTGLVAAIVVAAIATMGTDITALFGRLGGLIDGVASSGT